MAKYLLDTTALIDHLRGSHEVVQLITDLAHQGHQLGVCCINVAELYSGLSQSERAKAHRLIDTLEYYEVSRSAAKLAGSYRFDFARQGVTLSTADTIVAATAAEQDATVITANLKDYPMEEIKLLRQP